MIFKQENVLAARILFHASVPLIFLSALIWQAMNMKGEIPDHVYISDILNYKERYFTAWNITFQFIYFSMALLEDIDSELIKKYINFDAFVELKAKFFTAVVFPSTAFVVAVFWGYYFYDRELVYPRVADTFFTSYANHVCHTAIALFAIMELLFTRHHPEVSFKTCAIVLFTITILYYTLFAYHYFTKGRHLYPLFYNMKWFEIGEVMLGGYIWTLLASKFAIEAQKWLKKNETEERVSREDVF